MTQLNRLTAQSFLWMDFLDHVGWTYIRTALPQGLAVLLCGLIMK